MQMGPVGPVQGLMHSRYNLASRHQAGAMPHGYASGPCLRAMPHGHASGPCLMAMHQGHASGLCIRAMHQNAGLPAFEPCSGTSLPLVLLSSSPPSALCPSATIRPVLPLVQPCLRPGLQVRARVQEPVPGPQCPGPCVPQPQPNTLSWCTIAGRMGR